MRSRMTPSVYRHSGGSGLRPKPAGFLVPPPTSQGVNTPTRSTGHHVRVNSPQHILQDLKMCVQGQYVFISEYIPGACKPTRGQHFSKVNMWAGVCLTLGFLSAFLHVCFFPYYLSYLSLSGLLRNTVDYQYAVVIKNRGGLRQTSHLSSVAWSVAINT